MTPEEGAHAVDRPVNLWGTTWMFEPDTDAAPAPAFATLDAAERDELVALLTDVVG
jgi:hypothetical protein